MNAPNNQTLDFSTRSISGIARVIELDWQKVNYAARPYLEAMHSLGSLEDSFGYDNGTGIVAYFLCNASGWRGPVARQVKAELKRRLAAGKGGF